MTVAKLQQARLGLWTPNTRVLSTILAIRGTETLPSDVKPTGWVAAWPSRNSQHPPHTTA